MSQRYYYQKYYRSRSRSHKKYYDQNYDYKNYNDNNRRQYAPVQKKKNYDYYNQDNMIMIGTIIGIKIIVIEMITIIIMIENIQEIVQKEITSHSRSSSSNSSSNSSNNSAQSDSKNRSKDAGHYKYKKGETFDNGRYILIKHLSDGTFGRVFEVVDSHNNNKTIALKVIRAVDRYVEAAQTEGDIIMKINKMDPEDQYRIVRLYNTFKHQENFCMCFEKLGLSLFDLLKKNNYVPYKIQYVKSFFKQILESIGFLHLLKLTHTDLKPENILLVSSELKKSEIKCGKTSSPSTSYQSIKIIDFGGATFENEHHSDIINTRQYRAPEVILGCMRWNEISDVWSIGCIIMELYSGELLFPTHENYEHLAMIEKISGHIPKWMGNRAEHDHFSQNFNVSDEYFSKYRTHFDWPKNASSRKSIERVRELITVEQIIKPEHYLLKDLVKKCLIIDPKQRISCQEALKHSFFQ
ncbi:hypothetical protein IMG5_051550 [Ichthyophthirius multifiliis]|uniref:Protein kinase domain-containing protein n=1 Tax=Ichthyophthirius multifiliis TaxID=5932 RepID=G0QMS4_ICHMU|nr:hypothetical protein IMG5_051550 [Ichthyophthirius multifiliis]EGR33477.1 hypothetical protein IMG5_051550 [Ichthyophthirius multifiliis]|eukprot:XP_004037463.1 hypothetical protein IMG5_051550 [Ichthyophthirius multifiliis]